MPDHDFFIGARDATDAILRDVFKLDVEVFKALDPLNKAGFEKISRNLAHELKHHAQPIESAALNKAIQKLDVDWTNLSAAAHSKIIEAAQAQFATVPAAVLPKIEQTMAFYAKDIATTTKKKTVLAYDLNIAPNLSATDQRIVDFARTSQAHFVRDAYGERSEFLSNSARMIVAHGLKQGHGSTDISARLASTLTSAGRTDGYWTMIAMVFANRARTSVQVCSFGEAGIEAYTFEAVLDEATSMQCRFMHGRRFSVPKAVQLLKDVESYNDPEQVKEHQPFMHMSGDQLYLGSVGTGKFPIATVTENVVGQKDKIGSFQTKHTTADLESYGTQMPPLHGRCRSTVIPDFSTAPAATTVSVPAAPEPAAPKPKPAEVVAAALQEMAEYTDTVDGKKIVYGTNVGLQNLYLDHDLATPPYLDAFGPQKIDALIAANIAAKKKTYAFGDLIESKGSVPQETVAERIKSPKKLAAAAPVVVQYQGKLYVHDGLESIYAQKFLGKDTAKVHFVDLDGAIKQPAIPIQAPPPAAPHAPLHVNHPAPAMAPPPPAGHASVILGERVGAAQGSNEGGTYRGTDGVLRYVKFYKDKAQGPGEHLANSLYRELGHGAPTSTTFQHEGHTAYASELFSGVKTLGEVGLTPARAKEAMKGFVADVLTGNWDAVGMNLDNMIVDADGRLIRIDNGGTFLMRAKAGRKSDAVLNTITEWDKFFDPGMNPAYAKIAKAAGIESPRDMADVLVPQIKQLAALRDAHGGWAGYVEKMIGTTMPDADKAKVITMLEKRGALLEAKLPELTAPAPKKLPMGAPFEAPRGVRVKAPPADPELLAIRRFEDLPLRALPKLDTPPDGSLVHDYRDKAEREIAKATQAERDAATIFTGSDYTHIRTAQRCKTEAEFETASRGRDFARYQRLATQCESLTSNQAVGRVPGQVFRGLRDLPRGVIDAMMTNDTFDLMGTSSTSRTSSVAHSFMGGTSGSSHRAMLVIHQKSGVAIETISGISTEHEILLSKNTKLKVLARHRAAENPSILIVELEELTDEHEQQPEPPARRRRTRKPAAGGSAP